MIEYSIWPILACKVKKQYVQDNTSITYPNLRQVQIYVKYKVKKHYVQIPNIDIHYTPKFR